MHGKYSTYVNKKCRCDECSAAAREYQRNRIARSRGEGEYVPKKRGPKVKEEHGYSGYMNRSCRCEVCKKAASEYIKSRKTNSLGLDDPRHGTQNAYVNLGCRCDSCRQAVADYQRGSGNGRKSSLKRNYGITPEQWDDLFQSQDGKCASCGDVPPEDAKRRFHVDHDHSTGAVRGILCHSCNVALGYLKEDQERITKLGVYLAQWKPF